MPPAPPSAEEEAPPSAPGAPCLAVIIPNWNGQRYLGECLDALDRQTWRDAIELWVVDNGSTDGSLEVLASRPEVRVIRNSENQGFAAACNQGIAASSASFVGLVNNDVVVAQDWAERLVSTLQAGDDIGSATSKVLSYQDHRLIDNCGHLLYADGLTRGRGRLEVDRGQYDAVEEVFCVSGCACALRRRMLEDVGGFDEDFFAYCEDADLGFRARLRGWRCVYVPAAVAYHRFSASSATPYSPIKALYVERNRIWLAVKNLPLPLLVASIGFTFARYAWQAVGALSRRGSSGSFVRDHSAFSLLRILAASYVQALGRLPRMLRRRRQIQSGRKVTTREVSAWIRRYGIGPRRIALMD